MIDGMGGYHLYFCCSGVYKFVLVLEMGREKERRILINSANSTPLFLF